MAAKQIFEIKKLIPCNNVSHVVEVKSMKKIGGLKFGPKGPKSVQKLGFLFFSQVLFVSVL